MRVLIVDDSPVMRKVVERALRQAGIDLSDVLQAGNGTEALAMLRADAAPFDLITTDINMPGMDGLQFLEQRKHEDLAPGCPAFVITTETNAPQVHRAIAAGARGYICKPFTPEQIRGRIAALLRPSPVS
jgi:two-component system chemotaxis response regulator CheY